MLEINLSYLIINVALKHKNIKLFPLYLCIIKFGIFYNHLSKKIKNIKNVPIGSEVMHG